jgi:tRNA A-37 threonylcarbamoyl transferase component Bud32
MKTPGRLFRKLLVRWRQRPQVHEVGRQLSIVLGEPVRLEPASGSGGGLDSVFIAHAQHQPTRRLAGVRISRPNRSLPRADEPDLPRRVLSSDARIAREAEAYQRLSAAGLSPELLAQGAGFLANAWLPWPRASELLRQSEQRVWDILPLVLRAINTMHSCGVVHLDLNCGNILVRPDLQAVAFVDFEYGPAEGLSARAQQAFDLLRFTQGLLRPRRGLGAIQADQRRFVECLQTCCSRPASVGVETTPALATLPTACFRRISDYPAISHAIRQLSGAVESCLVQ